MSVVVRPARLTDVDVIVDFNAAMARETEGKQLDPARLRAGVAAALSDPARGAYHIAELNGRVAGTLLVTREWSDWRNGWFWWIQSVYVAPEARRAGVYRALHSEVLQRAAAERAVGVRLYVDRANTRAQRTYEHLGMQPSHYLFYETAPVDQSR